MLRYTNGEEIRCDDLCSSAHRRTLVRLFFVHTDGIIMTIKDMLSTKTKRVKDKEFIELKSGKGKKHFDFELIARKEDWIKIIDKLSEKALEKDLDMNYEIPEKIVKTWTKE